MSWSSRRAILVLVAAALLGGMALLQVQVKAQKGKEAPSQPNPNQPQAKTEGYNLGRLSLPKEKSEDLKELLDAAEDRIKEKEWKRACDILQKLVGRKEDVFVERVRQDKQGETKIYVSVKKESQRMIGALPPEGRKFYEADLGPKASQEFKQARTNNNFQQMAQVMALYLHTDAGADACNWCATYEMDRANFTAAANFYTILILRNETKDKPGVQTLKNGQLIKAAYAFHQVGDPGTQKLKAEALKELDRRGVEIPLDGGKKSVADLKEALDKFVVAISSESSSDVRLFAGTPSRNALQAGGTPFLQPTWNKKLTDSYQRVRKNKKTEIEVDPKVTAEIEKQVKTSLDTLATHNKEVFSAFVPVTATLTKGDKKVPLLVYRDYSGVAAVDMKTGDVVWDAKLEWSFGSVYSDVKNKDRPIDAYRQWMQNWQQNNVRPQIVFDNSVTGTLSADSEHVYAIEDLAIPAPQNLLVYNNPNQGAPQNNWGTEVNNALRYNKLIAIRQQGGKTPWELGGGEQGAPLNDSIFLGPPLPLNGKLYVLNEKQQEIRLITIDPPTGKVLAVQALANTKDLQLQHDPMRRVQACHISHAEGVLVIPTNAGAVFGIDLITGSLAWAYPYGEPAKAPPINQNNPNWRWQPAPPGWMWYNNNLVPIASQNQWMVTAPRIQDSKVVFSAPDARDIHCINLRDGARVWTRSRQDDDLYVAGVFNGKVIVVGKQRTRALGLTTGNVLWEVDTGLPSGMGAASPMKEGTDVIYYLPIRRALNTREPEICAINVDKGMIHAHTRSREGQVPGNLIFYEGSVLSQSHADVTAYPQLEVKLAQINGELKQKENDPALLTERGDYLLDRGDLVPAIDDFRTALKNSKIDDKTKAKARTKLYESYTEYFQRDFGKAEVFLKGELTYEEMCKIDTTNLQGDELSKAQAENRRRRANFLCLVGKGREAQEKYVEAFTHYLELGEGAQQGELIQVVDEPSVKAAPDVWSQGRIAAMVLNAKNKEQKDALAREIGSRWDKLKGEKNAEIGKLRNFVALFGSLFDVGKEARFALVERLVEDPGVNSMLEAEQHLVLLRNDASPAIAARAIETLGRLSTQKGLLEDAAYFYRILGEKYPKVEVNGKPGAEYLEDLATDKRFLPYLDQAGRYVIKNKVTTHDVEEKGSFYGHTVNYPLHNFGEDLPFFLRNRLVLDTNRNLRLKDAASGDERWSNVLDYTQFHHIATTNSASSRAQFGFQTQGHLVIMTLGHLLFAIDPLSKGRVVWQKNLSQLPNSDKQAPYPMNSAFPYDQRDGSVQILYTDGSAQRLGGQSGALQGGVVCMQTRDAMTALDPVTGRTLWTRTDVNSRAHVFGDDDHVYVVSMGENGQASGTRVFRAYDGVNVKVSDFSHLYEKRIRLMGRHLLAADVSVKGVITLKIYDILAGKNLFEKEFPQGSVQMQSEDPRLAGVVEPDGTCRVYDVMTQKEVLATNLRSQHDDKAINHAKPAMEARSIHLLSDPDYLFVAINGKLDNNAVGPGDVGPNYRAGQGLRSVPVNGNVYCFDRSTAKRRWYAEAPNQHLIVTQFEELPVLFFSSRYQELTGQFRNPVQVTKGFALGKHNGKVWWMPKDNEKMNLEQGLYFHSITMDHRTGKVELIGDSKKITLTATPIAK